MPTLIWLLLFSCKEFAEQVKFQEEMYADRTVDSMTLPMESNKSYRSVYPEIYSIPEHKKHNLTVIASIRIMSLTDTLYIQKPTILTPTQKPIWVNGSQLYH